MPQAQVRHAFVHTGVGRHRPEWAVSAAMAGARRGAAIVAIPCRAGSVNGARLGEQMQAWQAPAWQPQQEDIPSGGRGRQPTDVDTTIPNLPRR